MDLSEKQLPSLGKRIFLLWLNLTDAMFVEVLVRVGWVDDAWLLG